MIRVLLVFGTRPEAIKMCPLVRELKSRCAFETYVCVTGQHREMLSAVLDTFGVVPDYDLRIMQDHQTLFDITGRVLDGMRDVYDKVRPDIVLIHGDTTTTFAAGLAAFYMRIPIGHVEAGLRTYDLSAPFPEEFNRQSVDIISDLCFAPTENARRNLLELHKPAENIFVTGNTAIDALKTTVRADYSHPELDWASGSRLVLLTAHRRENLGDRMRGIFRAVSRVSDEFPDVKIIYPVHMNPEVHEAAAEFAGRDRIHLTDPLDAIDFHNFLARSYLILTDSGGIQEEAPHLGKPVLVLRDTTERPEGVDAGTLRLVGTDEQSVYREFSRLLTDRAEYEAMSRASNPYGDGHASQYIADALEERMK